MNFQEILKHNVSQLLHAVPFFSNGSREFLDDIVGKLKFEVYLNGEYICETGRKGDKMYFIQKGIVDVLTKDGELATSLGDGSHFGGTKKLQFLLLLMPLVYDVAFRVQVIFPV